MCVQLPFAQTTRELFMHKLEKSANKPAKNR